MTSQMERFLTDYLGPTATVPTTQEVRSRIRDCLLKDGIPKDWPDAPRARQSLARKLSKHLEIGGDDECWLWRGVRTTQGYGKIWHGAIVGAHRAAWMLAHGQRVPTGMCVCHTCDVRLCCNPSHMFLGSTADNISDMWNKGRAAKQPEGDESLSPRKRLNSIAVRVIRFLHNRGVSNVALAEAHGVRVDHISDIIHRRSWRSVA